MNCRDNKPATLCGFTFGKLFENNVFVEQKEREIILVTVR